MSDIPRVSIEALKAKYSLEPDLKDVYVEGLFDRDLLKKWCKDNSVRDYVFYEIDAIDVPFEILKKHQLTEGNRQRVIALATELQSVEADNVKFIADRDLHHWLGELNVIPKLHWTHYDSLEVYYFEERFINDLLIDVLKVTIPNWEYFMDSFVDTLKKMYAFRLADSKLGLKLNWLSYEKDLKYKDGIIKFDTDSYTKKIIMNNNKNSSKIIFSNEIHSFIHSLDGDPRHYVRGHDFVEMIVWTVKNCKGIKDFHTAKSIERLFFMATSKINDLAMVILNR